MKTSTLFFAISILWGISEIIFGRMKYSGSESASEHDRRSLRILWTTIIISVTAGVAAGIRGWGYLPSFRPVALPLGVAFILAGLLIRWTAVFTLHRYFTSNVDILPDHRLVQHGIYRFIRHPAYAGALLSFLGLGLGFSNWLSLLLIVPPVCAAFLNRIRVEEAALREAFGKAYEDYCRKTKRLLPGVY